MKNLIVLTFDDSYFKYFIPFCNSIKHNYPDHPKIYVYYDGSDENIISYLKQKENIEYKIYSEFIFDFDVNLGVVDNPKIYFKYFLWTDEFEEFENVLYLDVDLLVLGSFEKLFEKNEFFIVSDHSVNPNATLFKPEFKDDPKLRQILAGDNLKYPSGRDSMANAGVFLIPKKYRQKKYLNHLVSLTKKYNKFIQFADQSIISLWCNMNHIDYSTDYRYNLQILHFYSDPGRKTDILNDTKILHFSYYKADQLANVINTMKLLKISYGKYLQYKSFDTQYDLSDLSIVVPVKIDSNDRLRNLKILLNLLKLFFRNKEIIIIEQDSISRIPAHFLNDNEVRHYLIRSDYCHYKTRNLNYGTSLASNKYVMICDVDIIFMPDSIYEGLEKLKKGHDFVAPYNGLTVNIGRRFINRFFIPNKIKEGLNNLVYYEKDYDLKDKLHIYPNQYPLYGNSHYDNTGGCLLFCKQTFHHIGGFNSNIISYGYEDMEFNLRIRKMGYKIEKIERYNLYHLSHVRKSDSYYNNYYRSNRQEYLKVQNMSRDELFTYALNGFRKIIFDQLHEINIINEDDHYSITMSEQNKTDLKGVSILSVILTSNLKDQEEMLFYHNKIQDMVIFFDEFFINYEIIVYEINGEFFKYLSHKKNYIYYNLFVKNPLNRNILDEILNSVNHSKILFVGLKSELEKEKIIKIVNQPDYNLDTTETIDSIGSIIGGLHTGTEQFLLKKYPVPADDQSK